MLLILVVGIVIGIQSVGVVLMIALLVTPASSARQWTGHLGTMVLLASIFGAICGGVGSVLSASFTNVPTGPVIVLVATVLFMISLTAAPRRGLVARLIKRRKLEKSAQVAAAGGDR